MTGRWVALANGRWAPVAAVVGGLVLAALALGVARLGGFDLSWAVALVIGLSGAAVTVLALRLPTNDPVPLPPPARTAPAGTSFGDLGGLRFLVEGDFQDRQRFETRLRPRLAALAAERLWQHRGIDWRTPDGRAAAAPLLGPGVAALLTAPPGGLNLTPENLTSWIRELEAL